MRFALLLSSVFFLTSPKLFAQESKAYVVKPGEKVKNALPKEALYMYPQFKEGVVNFKNGTLGAARLNYNRLLDEIQFIDNKGDTLSLDDEKTIALVSVGMDTFYYYLGYVKVIADINKVKFAGKEKLRLSNRQKIGPMGQLVSASIDTYDKLSSAQGLDNIISQEVLTFSGYSTFFIGDLYNHFKPLNKKSLVNMYAKQQSEVENYLSENAINFSKAEDVEKLIKFLRTL
ncbi:MAG: hypothetical protein JWN83_1727 [Chitinophagaceae bacterium]|nr:hypothetical protein [Chitinophagaceae bacterium]